MPLLHHKRRHTWPYCGPVPHSGNQLVPGPVSVPIQAQALPPQPPQFVVPLVPTDLSGQQDDATSAGIIRPKTPSRAHRLWSISTPKHPVSNSIAASTSLRQIVRPPLDKARSLFVLPTTSASVAATATTTAAGTTGTAPGGNVVVSYFVPSPSPVPVPVPVSVSVQPQRPVLVGDRGRYCGVPPITRRHRRCHSERPRSWREPSASLWPLVEE